IALPLPSFPAQVTKSLDESTPMHRPLASTTGAPLMLSRVSRWAASRSGISCGMVLTGVVIRSAAVKSRKGLATARVVVVCMTHLLQGKKSVMELKSLSFGMANPVPSNVLSRGLSGTRLAVGKARSSERTIKAFCETSSMNSRMPSCTAPPFSADATDPDFLTLRDGSTVQVHVAGSGDREGLADFFGRLSPESRQRHFLSLALPRPELIASLCDCSEPRSGLTLVATRVQGGEARIIATGSYLAKDTRTAEVALAVADG